jgi:hypothetical protein
MTNSILNLAAVANNDPAVKIFLNSEFMYKCGESVTIFSKDKNVLSVYESTERGRFQEL